MKLQNHIAYKFVKDDDFSVAMLKKLHPEEFSKLNTKQCATLAESEAASDKAWFLWNLISPKNQKCFYISKPAFELINHIKNKTIDSKNDWSVFRDIKDTKLTFCLEANELYRVIIDREIIAISYIKANSETAHWMMFWFNRETNDRCDDLKEANYREIENLIWKILCFFFLSDTNEIVLKPKQKYGTITSGKVVNDSDFDITILTSRWNSSIIRTEGFWVSGHFAVRLTGTGRTSYRLVFIQSYKKRGYKRGAQKHLTNNSSHITHTQNGNVNQQTSQF